MEAKESFEFMTLNGQKVIIDKEDLWKVQGKRWRAREQAGDYYVQAPNALKLHRVIMDCPKDMVVDHINFNPLDNRKINLRVCTAKENLRYRRIGRRNKSGMKGARISRSGKYRAIYFTNQETINIGTFHSLELAAKMYDIHIKRDWGEFSKPNFELSPSEESELWEYYDWYRESKSICFRGNRWAVGARIEGKRIYIGCYNTETEARNARRHYLLTGEKLRRIGFRRHTRPNEVPSG